MNKWSWGSIWTEDRFSRIKGGNELDLKTQQNATQDQLKKKKKQPKSRHISSNGRTSSLKRKVKRLPEGKHRLLAE